MAQTMGGLRVAALATDGVEQVELTQPVEALRRTGAEVTVVSPKPGMIQATNHEIPGEMLPVDIAL